MVLSKSNQMSLNSLNHTDLRGVVICGGGYRYFTNSWILLHLLRKQGVDLPVELWMAPDERSEKIEKLLSSTGFEVRLRICNRVGESERNLPAGARSQWLLKPWALLNTSFREVLYLDADSFPVQNPAYLFGSPGNRVVFRGWKGL
jgi:alpha 1,2-mannosyltransferase